MNALFSGFTRRTVNPKFSLQSVSAASPSGLSGLGLGEDCAFTCVALDLAQGIFALGINNGDILLVSHPILSAAAGSNSAAEDRRLHSITTSQEQHRSSSSSPPPSSSIERLLVYGDSSSTSSLTSPGNMLFGSQPMRLSAIKSLTFKQGDKYLVAIDDKNQVMVWNTYSYSAVWERPLKLEANAEFISCHHVSKVSNWVFFGMSNGDIVFADLLKASIARFFISYGQLLECLPQQTVTTQYSRAASKRTSMDLPIEGGSGDVKKPAAAPPTADSSSVASTAANPDQSQDSSTKTSSLLPNISTALSSRTSHDSSRSSFDALSHLPQSPPLRQTDIPVSIQISPKDSNLILIAYQNGLMVLYNLSKRSIVHRFSIIPTEKVKNMLIRSTGKTFEEYTDEGELLLGPLTDACFRYDGEQIVSSHGGYLVFWNVEQSSSWVSNLKSTLTGGSSSSAKATEKSTSSSAGDTASLYFDRKPTLIRSVITTTAPKSTAATNSHQPLIHKLVWRKGFKSADHTFLFVAGGVDANIVGGGGECETDLTLLEFKSQDYSTTKRVYRIKVQETSSFLVNAVVDFAVLPHDCSSSTDTTSFDYSGFYLLLLFSNGKFRFKDLPLLHSSSTPVPASCCQESETRFYQHLPPSIFMHSLIPPLKSAGFLTCSSLVYSVSALKLARVPTEFTMPMFSSKTSNYQFPSSMVKNSLLDTSDMFVSAHADNKIVFWGKEKSRDFQSSVVSPWACLFSIDLSKWINITSLKSICLNFFQYDDCDAGGNLLICAGPHVLVFGFLGDCGQTNTKNTAVSTSKPSNIILESDAGGEYGEGEKLMQTGVEESEGGLDDEAVENQGNYEHEGSEEAIKMKGIDVIENMDSMMSEVDDILLDVLQDSKNVKELMSKNTIAKDIIPNASSSSEGRKSLQLDRHRHPHLKQSIFPKRIWNLSVGSLAGQPTIKSDSNEPKYREDVVIERSGLNVKVDGSGWYPMIQVVHLDVVSSCCYAPWLGLLATVSIKKNITFVNTVTGQQILKDRLSDCRDFEEDDISAPSESMATHPMVFANTYFDDDKIVPCLLTMTSDGCLISYGIFNQQDPNSMPELRKELLLTPSPQEPIYVDVLNSNFIPLSNTQSKSSSEQHFIVLVLCKEIRLLTSNGTSKCGTDKIIGKGLGVNGTWFELKTKFWKGSTYHKAHILYFDDIPHLATITSRNVLYIYSFPQLELVWEADIPVEKTNCSSLQTLPSADGRILTEISKGKFRSYTIASSDTPSVHKLEPRMYQITRQSDFLRANAMSLASVSYDEHDRLFNLNTEETNMKQSGNSSTTGGSNMFSETKRMMNERGEKLNELNEKFGRLDSAASSFLSQIQAYNAKEAKKKWYQL